jgi:hypothetical protein
MHCCSRLFSQPAWQALDAAATTVARRYPHHPARETFLRDRRSYGGFPQSRDNLTICLKGGWSQWVDATLRSNPTCIENKGSNRSLGSDQRKATPARSWPSTAKQIGPPGEVLSDQLIRRCCIDRLSRHDVSVDGLPHVTGCQGQHSLLRAVDRSPSGDLA